MSQSAANKYGGDYGESLLFLVQDIRLFKFPSPTLYAESDIIKAHTDYHAKNELYAHMKVVTAYNEVK
jgi:hypothetical protein